MREEFLHYIWKFKKFNFGNAKTVSNLPIVIIDTGTANLNAGPDFFNAKMKIGDQLWAGNVEIHLKSSDWYVHRHETNPDYDNVILHVVWQDDLEVYRKDNTAIPTLELRELVPEITMQNYRDLLTAPNDKFINCEKDFPKFDDFELNNWLERLYFERLEQKEDVILELLKNSENNWEEVLFKLLSKNFGLNVNGEAFLGMAQSFDFKVVQKSAGSQLQLESLFFGQSGLLEKRTENIYYNKLRKEYSFLKRKFSLENTYVERAKFFRLRPDNFPSIRLSQLASLYQKVPQLFSEIIKARNKFQIYNIFKVETSQFWRTHYSFEKSHRERSKSLTERFIDLMIINTIVPLQFCYNKKMGIEVSSELLNLIEEVKAENNSVVTAYNKIRPKTAINAMQSQGLLHLKKQYCDKNACLDCNLGVKLIQGSI